MTQLDDRKIDAFITCVSVTEERKQQVAFVGYASDPFVFVAHPGTVVRTRGDLAGKALVVQRGTAAHGFAERLRREGVPVTVVARPTVPDTFAAVREASDRVLLEHERIVRHGLRPADPMLSVLPSDGVDRDLGDQRLGIVLRRDASALRAARAVGAME